MKKLEGDISHEETAALLDLARIAKTLRWSIAMPFKEDEDGRSEGVVIGKLSYINEILTKEQLLGYKVLTDEK